MFWHPMKPGHAILLLPIPGNFSVRKMKKKYCQNSKIQCNIHITFYLDVLTNFSSHLAYLSLQWVPVVIIMPQQNVLIMHFTVLQGFSQDFRIGCPKIHIWGELGVQFLFIPYTQKIWILGCLKDTGTPIWLKACCTVQFPESLRGMCFKRIIWLHIHIKAIKYRILFTAHFVPRVAKPARVNITENIAHCELLVFDNCTKILWMKLVFIHLCHPKQCKHQLQT